MVERKVFNAQGNLIRATDAEGDVTTLAYSPYGQPIAVIDPKHSATHHLRL